MSKSLRERIKLAEHGIWEEQRAIQQPIEYKNIIRPTVAIAVAVGISILALIFFLQPAIEKAKENPNISESTKALLSILPIVYTAVIFIGAISWMLLTSKESKEESITTESQMKQTG